MKNVALFSPTGIPKIRLKRLCLVFAYFGSAKLAQFQYLETRRFLTAASEDITRRRYLCRCVILFVLRIFVDRRIHFPVYVGGNLATNRSIGSGQPPEILRSSELVGEVKARL